MTRITLATGTAVLAGALVLGLGSPASATTVKAKALSASKTKLGKPYAAAAGPNSFDCSGLVQWSYKQAGKTLPRTAQAQYNATRHVSLSAAQPGDVLFWGKDSKHITHTGLFTGYTRSVGYTVNANTGSYRGRKVVNAPTSEYRLGGLKEYAGQVK